MPDDPHYYTRRHFLKLTGLAAVGLTAADWGSPTPATALQRASSRANTALPAYTVGVLLPTAFAATKPGKQFINGMSLFNPRLNLHIRTIESQAQLPTATEALCGDAAADVLVALINPLAAEQLAPVLETYGRVAVLTGVGANVPRSKHIAGLLDATLPHWQAAWSLGAWAARNVGSRAVMLHSLYESGYDAQFAFRCGFTWAGGEVIQTITTHMPGASDDPVAALADTAALKPDLVYASYSGAEGREFLQAWASTPALQRTTLLGTSSIDSTALATGSRLITGQAQAFDLAHTDQRRFVTSYKRLAGITPDLWALIGYRTAQALSDSTTMASDFAPAERFVIREFDRPNRTVRSRNLATVAAQHANDPQIARLRDSVHTGWLNTYLTDVV